MIEPWSSCGASSRFTPLNSTPMPSSTPAPNTSTAGRAPRLACSRRRYPCVTRDSVCSIARATRPSDIRLSSSSELSIGESVSAITADTHTAPASVKANSRNNEPVSPPISPIGAYTAMSVMVITITGDAISRAPSNAARAGGSPDSMCR